ncbi:acyl carrier protein [Nostoc sp. C117]|uniref:acyl carrier protein n=1 Tax=Nostoc sp. C117 TaxID=3349875 RepID=UPI00370D9D5A
MTSATDSFINAGLVQFFTENQNALLEWIQNFGNAKSNETFSYKKNSQVQLRAAYRQALPSPKLFQTEEVIQGWLVFYLSKLLLVNHSEININLPFEYYGITSLEALRLTHAIEVWLDRGLSIEVVYEYPTVQVLAQHLAQEVECVR